MKTSWYLYRKINFKLLINNQLGPAWRENISKIFGYLFLSALGPQPNISTRSILVFLLLQKFEFVLHVRHCCIIRTYSSDFNPSSYVYLWIGSVHQCHTASASSGEELIRLSSLGAGDLMLRDIVHQLKLLQLPKFDPVAQPWLELLQFIESIWPRSNNVASNWQEVPNGFFSKRCTCCPIS